MKFLRELFGRGSQKRIRPLVFQDQGKTLFVIIHSSPPKRFKARILYFLYEEGFWFVRLALFRGGNWQIEAFPMEKVYVEEGN